MDCVQSLEISQEPAGQPGRRIHISFRGSRCKSGPSAPAESRLWRFRGRPLEEGVKKTQVGQAQRRASPVGRVTRRPA